MGRRRRYRNRNAHARSHRPLNDKLRHRAEAEERKRVLQYATPIDNVRRAIPAADQRLWQCRRNAALAFGAVNNWQLSARAFAPQDIGTCRGRIDAFCERGWMDHPLYYKAGCVNACVVGQPYPYRDFAADLDALAAQLGLSWHTPPLPTASIHFPGATLFIALTMRDVQARWLADQQ